MGVAAWIRRRTFSPTTPAPSRRGGKRTCQSPSTWKRAATDPGMYASAPERILKAIGEPRGGRHRQGPAPRPHLPEPHHPHLSGLLGILRHGGDDRADRRLLPPRRAGVGGAQADPLPARPGRRRQVLPRRAPQGADGGGADLRAQGRRRAQPGLREPARPVRPRAHGREAGGPLRHPAPAPHRADEPLVPEAARRVRRRPLEVPGGEAQPLAPAPDRRRQDRAGRREQPGHLLARRQGRHPQAGDVRRRTIRTPTASPAA